MAKKQGFMTINQAAEYMGIGRRTVYRLMDMRAIAFCYVRLGKSTRRRVPVEECDRYMNRDRSMSNAELLQQGDLMLLEMERVRKSGRK